MTFRQDNAFGVFSSYNYYGPPDEIDNEATCSNIDEAISVYHQAVLARKHMPALVEYIIRNLTNGNIPKYTKDEDKFKLIMTYFSQKKWKSLNDIIETVHTSGSYQKVSSDLYFLSLVRMEKSRLLNGADIDGFQAESDSFLKKHESIFPKLNHRRNIYKHLINHMKGDVESARKSITSLKTLPKFITQLNPVSTILDSSKNNIGANQFIVYKKSKFTKCILLSIDEVYFRRYGRIFLENSIRSGSQTGVHFHCINFDPTSIYNDLTDFHEFGYSIEYYDLANEGSSNQRGYYACARYIHLYEYLHEYEMIFVMDIDGIHTESIEKYDRNLSKYDVYLSSSALSKSRTLFKLPWEAVSAASFICKDTLGGKEFAKHLKGYILECWEKSRSNKGYMWFCDQTALFYTWFDMRDIIDFGCIESSIYQQGGSWKLFEGEIEKRRFMKSIET